MKIDREVILLERYIAQSDFVQARRVIESNLEKFKSMRVRSQLSLETISLINSVVIFNEGDNKELFSRETQLIIQHINKLASSGDLTGLKRYVSFHESLLSNPRIYNMLNTDARILAPQPKKLQEA